MEVACNYCPQRHDGAFFCQGDHECARWRFVTGGRSSCCRANALNSGNGVLGTEFRKHYFFDSIFPSCIGWEL